MLSRAIELHQSETSTEADWLPRPRRPERTELDTRRRFAQLKLGEIMVMLGLIDDTARDKALARQEKWGMLFGECCLRMKLIDSDGLSQALARQFGYMQPVVDRKTVSRDLAMVSKPFGRYAEALRSVAHRLMAHWLSEDPDLSFDKRQVLAVSSAEHGTGRSHVAANLAVAFAQAGRKTLLIDADLRRPSQHRLFGISQHPGLSRLLTGYAPSDVVHQLASVNALSVITAGPQPPNPVELLTRSKLDALIAQARDHYDVVVVDTPPGGVYPDAELIAGAVGSALLIARRDHTRQRRLRSFMSTLKKADTYIAGTLLNDF